MTKHCIPSITTIQCIFVTIYMHQQTVKNETEKYLCFNCFLTHRVNEFKSKRRFKNCHKNIIHSLTW